MKGAALWLALCGALIAGDAAAQLQLQDQSVGGARYYRPRYYHRPYYRRLPEQGGGKPVARPPARPVAQRRAKPTANPRRPATMSTPTQRTKPHRRGSAPHD